LITWRPAGFSGGSFYFLGRGGPRAKKSPDGFCGLGTSVPPRWWKAGPSGPVAPGSSRPTCACFTSGP